MASAAPSGVLVYGATGYTGNLVARKVKEVGLNATLAGRNAEKVKEIATEVGLPYEAFDLSDVGKLDEAVGRHKVVLHIAGPYTVTSPPMLDACLRNKAHYLDITGELKVVDAARKRDEEAKSSGLTLMPAVGMDAVVGDCLALHLKRRLPTATHLDLGLLIQRLAGSKKPSTSFSRGTAKSLFVGILPHGGLARKNGDFVEESVGERRKAFDLGDGIDKDAAPFASFPACELVVTAHSTNIPNITTYMPANFKLPPPRVLKLLSPVLKTNVFKSFASFAIDKFTPKGPEEEDIQGVRMSAAGEARDETSGEVVRAVATVGPAYPFTTRCAVEIARRILDGDFKPGFQTAASAYGADFLLSIPGEDGEIKDVPVTDK